MSFLFTFSLPRLSFPNPFSITDSSEQRSMQTSAQGRRRSGGEGRRPRTEYEHDDGRYEEYYPREAYDTRDHVRRGPRRQQQPLGVVSGGGERVETSSSRKRKNIQRSFDEREYGYGYEDVHSVRDVHSAGFSRGYQAAEQDDSRPSAKRRRMGIVETVLTTAISVAIVSTAVGYTAYRMWRDGGLTANPKAVEAAEQNDEPEDETSHRVDPGSTRVMFGTSNGGFASPPPPPYYASSEMTMSGRNHGPPLRSSNERGPSRGREKRKNVKKRRVSTRGRVEEPEGVLLPPSPLKRKMEEQSEQSKPEVVIQGDVLEEQMDWMSARLQGLIEDGQRALSKEIVLDSEWEEE